MNNEMTRRNFFAGAAAVGMGIAVASSLTGCSDKAEAAEKVTEPTEFYDADFCVCGTGTSGLCAATRAAELGAKVVVLEALSEEGLGGNSKYVEACWAPANQSVVEKSYTSLIDYHKNAGNPIITRAFCNQALDILDWTMNYQKVQFAGTSGIESLSATSPAIKYAELEDTYPEINAGKCAILTMYDLAISQGIEFIWDARAVELIMDENGAVAGIIAERLDGTRLQVNAPAVDFCTGGYSANKDMFERYTNIKYDDVIAYGTSGSQKGDGINAGLAVGALLHHPEAINWCSPVLPGHFNKSALVICGCNQADTIMFNQDGRRFMDESFIKDWTTSGNAGCLQQHIYVIIDQAFVEKIQTQGPATKRTNYFKTNEPVGYFQDEIDEALQRESPRVVKGDTLEEIAQFLNLDADNLKDEIQKWNGYVDEGYDWEFQKPKEFMRKLETPPYYGFKTVLAFYNSVGGLKIDEMGRVINNDFKPIPGLYAGGSDAGGLFGGCYDVSTAPGSTQMWARWSGHVAATHAVTTYLKDTQSQL